MTSRPEQPPLPPPDSGENATPPPPLEPPPPPPVFPTFQQLRSGGLGTDHSFAVYPTSSTCWPPAVFAPFQQGDYEQQYNFPVVSGYGNMPQSSTQIYGDYSMNTTSQPVSVDSFPADSYRSSSTLNSRGELQDLIHPPPPPPPPIGTNSENLSDYHYGSSNHLQHEETYQDDSGAACWF
ncbi:hypothetical protein AB6A40_009456 [Gnathostoma spinigerum]|uniref:Uncharacterized protein n=1 Tax=Gnathostoma spinigerum TaxID=75299 RepID=A0ABD6F0V3_9BILA